MSYDTAIKSKIIFAKQLNGYDREQVDSYIKTLEQAYQKAYDEYNAVCAKYKRLLEECTALKKQNTASEANAKVLTRTLVDAETMAQRIIADAQSEAERIKGDAYIEKAAAKRSIEVTNEYLGKTISQLQSLLTVSS